MTRKKWNRLRRQRPELFKDCEPWERFDGQALYYAVKTKPAEVIADRAASIIRGDRYSFPLDANVPW